MADEIVPHPLMGIQSEKRDFAAMTESAFEEDTVKFLLQELDLQKLKFPLLNHWKAQTGQSRLTLTGFCQFFDTFPLVLRPITANISHSDRLSTLFRQFDDRPLIRKWKDLRDDLPREMRGRPFGAIVKWPFIKRGLVFHTRGDTGGGGLRLQWRDRKFQLTAEPLTQLVDWLKQNWSR